MRKKKILTLAIAFLALVPAFAVLSEKDLAHTLSVLRYELRSTWQDTQARNERLRSRNARQHARLVQMMQRSNELAHAVVVGQRETEIGSQMGQRTSSHRVRTLN